MVYHELYRSAGCTTQSSSIYINPEAQGLLEEFCELRPIMPLSLSCQLVPVLNESMTCPQSQSQWKEQDRFLDSDIEPFESYPPNPSSLPEDAHLSIHTLGAMAGRSAPQGSLTDHKWEDSGRVK